MTFNMVDMKRMFENHAWRETSSLFLSFSFFFFFFFCSVFCFCFCCCCFVLVVVAQDWRANTIDFIDPDVNRMVQKVYRLTSISLFVISFFHFSLSSSSCLVFYLLARFLLVCREARTKTSPKALGKQPALDASPVINLNSLLL